MLIHTLAHFIEDIARYDDEFCLLVMSICRKWRIPWGLIGIFMRGLHLPSLERRIREIGEFLFYKIDPYDLGVDKKDLLG